MCDECFMSSKAVKHVWFSQLGGVAQRKTKEFFSCSSYVIYTLYIQTWEWIKIKVIQNLKKHLVQWKYFPSFSKRIVFTACENKRVCALLAGHCTQGLKSWSDCFMFLTYQVKNSFSGYTKRSCVSEHILPAYVKNRLYFFCITLLEYYVNWNL